MHVITAQTNHRPNSAKAVDEQNDATNKGTSQFAISDDIVKHVGRFGAHASSDNANSDRGRGNDENAIKDDKVGEEQEKFVVVATDAIGNPRTMVVKVLHAVVTGATVRRAIGSIDETRVTELVLSIEFGQIASIDVFQRQCRRSVVNNGSSTSAPWNHAV